MECAGLTRGEIVTPVSAQGLESAEEGHKIRLKALERANKMNLC